ncbi:MAG TPA: endonuclease/exonuclease/phosphatase family protein [Kofleriaceae bacterium]|jgi:endonuclease/exonuclease/phosphatase family metal-dependent hydrolase|nr:endonuclease/exonuclease/phosphatase family protein [Kofleriaceae bacterium]
MKLKFVSYNIHKCIGGVDRRYEPERTAEVLRKLDADVLLLQEVDQGVPRSRGDKQTDVLADLCGMRYRTWYPNVEVRGGGQYGNAILSRYPLIESSNIDLTWRFKKRRSALHAVIRVRHGETDRTVHVYNMHLGLARFERRIQLKTFLDSHPFANLHHETPILVGGDLNDVYGGLSELLAPAGFRGIERRPLTFPAWGPVRPLDAIFVRGNMDFMKLARCDSELAKRASDHRPLVAEVRLHAHHLQHPHQHDSKPPSPRP